MDEYFHTTPPDGDEQIGVLKSRRVVRTFPAADVVEVKRGEWIDTVTGYACSICHTQEPTKRFLYCPNCGARMDGRSDT